ncbi:MAG TPA: metal transporter [Chloroflexi bacterium]|jgi:ZIP family zinc transporter|nr:metal transporter [Chloroflexota bacterium]
MYKEEPARAAAPRLPAWTAGLIPLLVLGALLLLFSAVNPLGMFSQDLPPIEALTIERIKVLDNGFEVSVLNSGPDPVTIAQVMVDDAYWQFSAQPGQRLARLARATVFIPYQWIYAEPHNIILVTDTGLTFAGEVAVAAPTPTPGLREFAGYGLLGVYVGVIPVAVGLMWYPAMRRMGRKWLEALLALTLGLLVFLLIDTFLEVLETGAAVPAAFQAVPLAVFAALLTWLAIAALSARRRAGAEPARGLYLAGLIALSIGLHNFGEGLAVGAALALGEVALGTFLVVGFILHNLTEGVGIAAPLVKDAGQETEEGRSGPPLAVFAGLALLAGFPAVLGAWIGGFAFSPLLGVIFLGIGLGAIWQVIVEVAALLRRSASREGGALSWTNLGGFLLGLAIMYLTALLVKF